MPKLSVLIPARHEEYLLQTVQDLLMNMRGDTEILVVLDGEWPCEPIPDDPRVHLIYHPTVIGQRAAVNEMARVSTADYLMKLDAHCAVDEGFDVKLMQPYENGELEGDVTTIPRMYNLHVFNWECEACGGEMYQGDVPKACLRCQGKGPFNRVLVWQPNRKVTDFAYFDTQPKFQYFRRGGRRLEHVGEIADVMTSVGCCFVMRRDRFWALGGLDEAYGCWGSFGIEIACKSWLSGGRHVVNKRTWIAHAFRTQGGAWGFPYSLSQGQADRAKSRARDIWFHNAWSGQTRPLSWLIEKFAPLPEWHDLAGVEALAEVTRAGEQFCSRSAAPTVGLVYYSDLHADPVILDACLRQLKRCTNGHEAVSVTLAPVDLGRNIVLPLQRSRLTMFTQILTGLEALTTDYVFLCEHDVLYHPSHFDFVPPRDDTFYYNTNVWRVDAKTGRAVTYDTMQVSGLCASRKLLVDHYRDLVSLVERHGYDHSMGYEPGTHPGRRRGVDDAPALAWRSVQPNVDIRHRGNLTASRWSPSEFHDPLTCQGWQETDEVPGWGVTKDRFSQWLQEQGT